VLLSLPAIISFVNLLPFIERGQKQGLDFVLENSMPPACMFSLLSPFGTTANHSWLDTNILMRSIYIGIVPLIFVLYTILTGTLKRNKTIRFFFITSIVLFGMAWGSHFILRSLAYYIIPGMNTFRHPALFRFFGVIFLLLIAGFGINEWSKKNYPAVLLRRIVLLLLGFLIALSAIFILFPGASWIPVGLQTKNLKVLLDSLNFQQRFLIQVPFAIAALLALYFISNRKGSLKYLLLVSITDLFFSTQLNMPVTVIGARSFSDTKLLMKRNPEKFPLPGTGSIEQNALGSVDHTHTVHTLLPFVKRIARNDYFITPGNLASQEKFYESAIREKVFKNPLIYFADTVIKQAGPFDPSKIKKYSFALIAPERPLFTDHVAPWATVQITGLSANSLACFTNSAEPGLLILLQNNYEGWKVYIDGLASDIFTTNLTFMGVQVPAGKHAIVFRYRPDAIIYAWYISISTLLALLCFVTRFFYRERVFFSQHHQGNTHGKPYKL
jgi:hypothetical protein